MAEQQPVTIPLTKGKEAVIDAADLGLVGGMKWCALGPNKAGKFYAVRREPGTGRTLYMHRVISGAADNVDHRDGDGLNNRRSNLRPCNQQMNSANRRPDRRSTTGFKGASLNKTYGKWESYIHVNGKKQTLGFFASATEAARAYDAAALAAFGEFASLNFGSSNGSV